VGFALHLLVYNNKHSSNRAISDDVIIYFASAAVDVDSINMTAASASWSKFSPPSNFVNGHVSTMRFMVCRWTGNWARPNLC